MFLASLVCTLALGLAFIVVTVGGQLTTSYTGRPCPGETVTLTCAVTGDLLIWEPGQFGRIQHVRGFIGNDAVSPAGAPEITALVTSITNTTITAQLVIQQVPEGGINVTCVDVGTVMIQLAAPPTPPQRLGHSIESISVSEAFILVHWSPPTDDGGRDDLTYRVSISPLTQLSATVVNSTSVTVSTDYNVDYNVSIVASNCAGNSNISEYNFRQLPPVTCAQPLPPVNGSIVNVTLPTTSLEGTRIYYRCDENLFPVEELSSVCSAAGMWSPDPRDQLCSPESFSCDFPAPPTNGFVLRLSNTTVVFGCNEGFSPQENRTANCVARNQWSPSSEEILQWMCVAPTESTQTETNPPDILSDMPSPNIVVIVGVVVGVVAILLVLVIVISVVMCCRKRKVEEARLVSTNGFEMEEKLNGEYSELRHDGPRSSKKNQPPPTNTDGYNRITHNLESERVPDGALVYDQVTLNTPRKLEVNSDGYSELNNEQGTQRLPGYGQLNNMPTVEPVVYADLGPRVQKSKTSTVDQHQVTYSTVDMEATNRRKAATLPVSPPSSNNDDADKLLNLDQALIQLRPVQTRWKELAEALRMPEILIGQVEEMCQGDTANCMTEVADNWIRTCGQPTWRELADALREIGEDELAQQLMSIYETGRLPVELNMKAVPKEVYKYDNAPPPPIPSRSPNSTDSPELSRTMPPMRPPKPGADGRPVRPPKPSSRDGPADTPPRPPKPPL